jgi:hypothetical protein
MAQSTAQQTYSVSPLLPLYSEAEYPAPVLPVNLQPSTVFARGTVLGLIASSANDVQTLTVTGTPTGGTITVSFTDPITGAATTFSLAFNSSTASSQTAIRAAIGNSDVAVTGGTLPGSTNIFTFSGRYAGLPVPPMTVATNALTGGTSPAASFAHTTTGRSAGTYGAYTDGGTTDPAVCLLKYACATDSSGRDHLRHGRHGRRGGPGGPDRPRLLRRHLLHGRADRPRRGRRRQPRRRLPRRQFHLGYVEILTYL